MLTIKIFVVNILNQTESSVMYESKNILKWLGFILQYRSRLYSISCTGEFLYAQICTLHQAQFV